ncbi:hypothetical protein HMPREF1991_01084 [Hoylesella loescheii DSM 19665 = JCM 12249 = ATCC 15930]|uniref:Uncharacterized protein n=1 Tax=Hoylesella loescheii DSM 19665 = JCM 12249 = ATCC 15930 TaxID=1122985 RepID=A0A069QJ49_HOYLO|nr:hypothetical protein HMPREF1991_01084 [Hoylesella loescheii DSM 19665 = JCM 12249 = ATCC 15930]
MFSQNPAGKMRYLNIKRSLHQNSPMAGRNTDSDHRYTIYI